MLGILGYLQTLVQPIKTSNSKWTWVRLGDRPLENGLSRFPEHFKTSDTMDGILKSLFKIKIFWEPRFLVNLTTVLHSLGVLLESIFCRDFQFHNSFSNQYNGVIKEIFFLHLHRSRSSSQSTIRTRRRGCDCLRQTCALTSAVNFARQKARLSPTLRIRKPGLPHSSYTGPCEIRSMWYTVWPVRLLGSSLRSLCVGGEFLSFSDCQGTVRVMRV